MASLEIARSEMIRRGFLVEKIIREHKPELLDLFFIYQNEALASRAFLEESLAALQPAANLLEVGGGILALAAQLSSEGYEVTTVEPAGEGFGRIEFIMGAFAEVAKAEGLVFTFINLPIEDCVFRSQFDFIFSINVMEHLADPYNVAHNLCNYLTPDASYRFFCPNYDFPYEPHFGKLLFTRKNGAFFLPKSRSFSKLISPTEASGVYSTINFISMRKFLLFATSQSISVNSNRAATENLVKRASVDSELRKRHPALSKLAALIINFKFYAILRLVPVKLQPVMDVSIH